MTNSRALAAGLHANDALLSLVGHEMRNPLAAISLALHTLGRAEGRQAEKAVQLIGSQVRLLASLADELQDAARIAAGGVRIQRHRVLLREVLVASIETTSHTFAARGQSLKTHLPASDVYCDADGIRLGQVFINLLTNAARYTPPGGRVELVAERRGDQCSVRIKDNGCGISAEDLPSIFELYFRGAHAPAWDSSGLGIGLALVQTIVQLHGGTVVARSAGPGHGSEFLVALPVELEAAGQPCCASSAG